MKQKSYYRVGGHLFSIQAEESVSGELNFQPYEPFKIEMPLDEQPLFRVDIVDHIDVETLEDVIVDAPLSSPGMPQVNIYRINGGFLYNIIMPYNKIVNASVAIIDEQRQVRVALSGGSAVKSMAMNNAVILSFITFAMERSTLLLHASTVMHQGRAYLFLGKSGTGKSTHSRMWLEAFEGAELLNDDHPIVRCYDDGTAEVFGSPWSGKTPCYRNLSAPLGAIVRISRSDSNSLEELRPLKAFASLTTSCSGAQWSKKLIDDKVKAVEAVVSSAKGFVMHCLPNVDAARVCYNGIREEQ